MATPPNVVPTAAPPPVTLADLQQEIAVLKAQQNAPKASSFMNTVMAHWKSTVNGLLGFGIATGVILLATGNNTLSPTVTKWVTLGLALARGYVLIISKDASALTTADISKQTAVATAKQA